MKKRTLQLTLPTPYLEGLNLLINDGLYENQAEIVKDALRRLFSHYEITAISDVYTKNYNHPNTAKNNPNNQNPNENTHQPK